VTTGKVVRALLGLLILLVLLFTVNGWWAEYKHAQPKAGGESTSTADATQTAAPEVPGAAVLILTDGLQFREKPDATGARIRGLKKGETFVLVSEAGDYLQIRDASGKVGWVNNNKQYVQVKK